MKSLIPLVVFVSIAAVAASQVARNLRRGALNPGVPGVRVPSFDLVARSGSDAIGQDIARRSFHLEGHHIGQRGNNKRPNIDQNVEQEGGNEGENGQNAAQACQNEGQNNQNENRNVEQNGENKHKRQNVDQNVEQEGENEGGDGQNVAQGCQNEGQNGQDGQDGQNDGQNVDQNVDQNGGNNVAGNMVVAGNGTVDCAVGAQATTAAAQETAVVESPAVTPTSDAAAAPAETGNAAAVANGADTTGIVVPCQINAVAVANGTAALGGAVNPIAPALQAGKGKNGKNRKKQKGKNRKNANAAAAQANDGAGGQNQ